jgi:Protein of unknown function (DUF2726)
VRFTPSEFTRASERRRSNASFESYLRRSPLRPERPDWVMTCRRLLPRKVCIRQTFALTFHGNLVEIGKGCAQGAKQIGFFSSDAACRHAAAHCRQGNLSRLLQNRTVRRQTSCIVADSRLGEVLRSKDADAYSCINSKRVDLHLVDKDCLPSHAMEYQGGVAHHRGTAAARDAVKKEALRRAGIGYHWSSLASSERCHRGCGVATFRLWQFRHKAFSLLCRKMCRNRDYGENRVCRLNINSLISLEILVGVHRIELWTR